MADESSSDEDMEEAGQGEGEQAEAASADAAASSEDDDGDDDDDDGEELPPDVLDPPPAPEHTYRWQDEEHTRECLSPPPGYHATYRCRSAIMQVHCQRVVLDADLEPFMLSVFEFKASLSACNFARMLQGWKR